MKLVSVTITAAGKKPEAKTVPGAKPQVLVSGSVVILNPTAKKGPLSRRVELNWETTPISAVKRQLAKYKDRDFKYGTDWTYGRNDKNFPDISSIFVSSYTKGVGPGKSKYFKGKTALGKFVKYLFS